jgi:hypothetical protein
MNKSMTKKHKSHLKKKPKNMKNTKNMKNMKTIKNMKKPHNKTIKHNKRDIIVPTKTPSNIRKISNRIADKIDSGSYSPTINKDLVTLKSISRKELLDCNMEAAFNLKEPLQIGISGKLYGKNCYYYYTPEAKKFLLRNLAADKHIDPKKIIPPVQAQSNCWFNAMFVTFFVSDKGRKFFHFLRQLMIEGKQKDGTIIPDILRDAFALLNFGIDACLTGNKYAYKLDTNSIIHLLYKNIPKVYKTQNPYIVDVDKAGNPIYYYTSIINYLNNSSIQMLFIQGANDTWKDNVLENVKKMTHLPHIIVLEFYEEDAETFKKKPNSFKLNDAKYEMDSAVVRDTTKQHFCATITCEGQEMGYDGMSFHRLSPMKWKDYLNTNISWQFEGTKDYDGTPLEWNFTKSYQLLMYYRVK